MSKPPAERWSFWAERLRRAAEGGAWPRELGVIAAEVSRVVGARGPLVERWARAGVEVRIVRMRGRGRCDVLSPTPRVFVKLRENRPAQHFTVAHEVAHLLLGSLPEDLVRSISLREEEGLCDGFAREVVVPPVKLNALLTPGGAPLPQEVLTLCGAFGANPSVLLSALDHRGELGSYAYVLARWRGHYRRPDVVGFRIDAAIGPAGLFWPLGKRLRGLGLMNLARDASRAPHGTLFEGRDSLVTIHRRRLDPRSGDNAMVGPVSWEAARQGRQEPYLLARIECASLEAARISSAGEQRAIEIAPSRLRIPGVAIGG